MSRRRAFCLGMVVFVVGCNDILGIRAPREAPGSGGGSGTTGRGGATGTSARGGGAGSTARGGAGGSTGRGGAGATGASGNAGTGGARPVVLVPNDAGFLDGTNAAGVIGAWYSYSDAGGSCQMGG